MIDVIQYLSSAHARLLSGPSRALTAATRSTVALTRALNPATCCLGDNCLYSALTVLVGSRQLRLGSTPLSAVWLAAVRPGGMTARMTSNASYGGFKRNGRRHLEGSFGWCEVRVVEQVAHGSLVAEPCHGAWSATLISDTSSGHHQLPWRRESRGVAHRRHAGGPGATHLSACAVHMGGAGPRQCRDSSSFVR